jgi:excisionase family DNA binding protein
MERALTVKDVAKRYGVMTKTVYAWIKGGQLPCLALPGRRGGYRIHERHLDEFERRRGRNLTQEPRMLPSRHPEPPPPKPAPPRDAFERGRAAAQRRAPTRPLLGAAR